MTLGKRLCPSFADDLGQRETAWGSQAPDEIIGRNEIGDELRELIEAVVMEAFDSSLLDRAAHPLELTARPGMTRSGPAIPRRGRLSGRTARSIISAHLNFRAPAMPCHPHLPGTMRSSGEIPDRDGEHDSGVDRMIMAPSKQQQCHHWARRMNGQRD